VTTATRTPPHHDTLTCVKNYGCRLPACQQRASDWERDRRQQKAAGTWQSHVDAEPVRQHLHMLSAHNITPRRAAILAGTGLATLYTLLPAQNGQRRPVKHTVTADVAERILAINPADVTPGHVDPTGTVRRIQALVATGWPMARVAKPLGLHPSYVSNLIRRAAAQCTVTGSTATKVADAYTTLSQKRPGRHGINAQAVKRAKNFAASRRWPDTRYWAQHLDAINDPHFTPDYGLTRAELLAQEAHWLITAAGLNRTQAAERLGKDRSYIDRVLSEYPQAVAA
jgi:hypothetical protein